MMPGQTEKTGWNRRSSSSRPKKAAGDRADGVCWVLEWFSSHGTQG